MPLNATTTHRLVWYGDWYAKNGSDQRSLLFGLESWCETDLVETEHWSILT